MNKIFTVPCTMMVLLLNLAIHQTTAQTLWGMSSDGGSNVNGGNIFSINTDGTGYKERYAFLKSDSSPNGYGPHGSLILAKDGNLYGIASHAIHLFKEGVTFSIKTDGTGYKSLLQLKNFPGQGAYGSLLESNNGYFYGMNNATATMFADEGSIFRFRVAGSAVYSNEYFQFGFAPGMVDKPTGSLIQGTDSYLYGMAPESHSKYGGIFKIDPLGNNYSVIHFFTSTDGANPKGSLVQDTEGYLYGMTENGGLQGWGVIFKVKTDGTAYQVLFQFGQGNAYYTAANGTHPRGSLLLANDGKLYGMAHGGGTMVSGTVFRINTNGGGFQVIYNFTPATGMLPSASLIQDKNTGFLYGMTEQGGAFNFGTIFKINTNGSGYLKLLDFNGINGKYPEGDLLLIPSGVFMAKAAAAAVKEQVPAENGNLINIAPNPVHHSFHIYFQMPAAGKVMLVITDVNGKTVKQKIIPATRGEFSQLVDVSELPAAVYLLKIVTPNHQFEKKIVKQ